MLTDLEQFFYDNAGYGFYPARETAEEGKEKNAKELAKAYEELQSEPAFVAWNIDPDITTADFDSERPKEPTLCATLIYCYEPDEEYGSGEERVVGFLGGIDVKDQSTSDPYCKVIEAELWAEFAREREACLVRGEN